MRRTLLSLSAAAMLLGACSDDMSDLRRDVAAIKARTSTKIPPIPQPKQFDPFTYVPGDRRDPFVEGLARLGASTSTHGSRRAPGT